MTEQAGRIATALVAVPLLYVIVVWAPVALFSVVVLFVVALAQIELYKMALGAGSAAGAVPVAGRVPVFAVGVLVGVAVTAGVGFVPGWESVFPALLTSAVLAVAVTALACGRDFRTAGLDAAVALFGVLYLAWLLSSLVSLRRLPGGEWFVVSVLAITWGADAAAYYVGRAWGRRPLAPRVSPKKTVEGAVGAVVGGAAVAAVASMWFLAGLRWPEAVVVGGMLAGAGMLGDLFESLLKRGAGVKDSGGLIPSHGGILDKIDGLVFTAPALYYYLVWLKGYGGVTPAS